MLNDIQHAGAADSIGAGSKDPQAKVVKWRRPIHVLHGVAMNGTVETGVPEL